MEDVVAIFMLFGGGTLVMLSFSPVGKALAERIRGRTPAHDSEVLAELEQLREDMLEVQERLDFTERMLSRQNDAARLGPTSDGGDA